MTKRRGAKKAAKRKTTKRVAKKVTKRKAKRKIRKVAKKKVDHSGYRRNRGGKILVPKKTEAIDTVVAPSKLVSGIKKAKREIQDIVDELSDFADGYDVSEVSLEVSFNADGKFLGVGVGGATSLGLKLTPTNE